MGFILVWRNLPKAFSSHPNVTSIFHSPPESFVPPPAPGWANGTRWSSGPAPASTCVFWDTTENHKQKQKTNKQKQPKTQKIRKHWRCLLFFIVLGLMQHCNYFPEVFLLKIFNVYAAAHLHDSILLYVLLGRIPIHVFVFSYKLRFSPFKIVALWSHEYNMKMKLFILSISSL